MSFIDRCLLLPNGGRRLFTLHLFPLLSSKVQSALKALHTDFLPSEFIASSLFVCFTPHLYGITFILCLCECLGQRLRQLLVAGETALCFYVTER